MQVLDVHAAFLSNYEVLALMEADVKEQEKAILRYKKSVPPKLRNSKEPIPGQPYIDYKNSIQKIVPSNLRTVQVETLNYLTQNALPCQKQTPKSIKRMLDALAEVPTLPDASSSSGTNALTKTEKLMLVNLAPTAAVDLHVIIDELESRFSEEAIGQLLEIFDPASTNNAEEEKAEASAHDAADAVKEEEEEAAELEEEIEEDQNRMNEEIYADEDDNLDEADFMPDEENDLVDEGTGDAGRDAEMREIDEVQET